MATKHVSDDEFDGTVLGSQGAVLVDFWAEWCGPCKQISPVLDEIAKEFEGKVTVAKVNIDQNPEAPQRFGVRGIPTLILFKDGKPVATKVGSMPKGQLVDWLNSVVA
ncbi:MAG: thiol reductase thioredoxin [Azospirillum brasilense]|nr:MAG: thiol reductase thioredoxin [Azospirillum brasilense]